MRLVPEGNEGADDEAGGNSDDEAGDQTDLEYEELVYSSARSAREGSVQTKSWVDMRKQLDDILKREKVKRQLPFSQVIRIFLNW